MYLADLSASNTFDRPREAMARRQAGSFVGLLSDTNQIQNARAGDIRPMYLSYSHGEIVFLFNNFFS